MRKIELVNYCDSWPIDYEVEVKSLKELIKGNFIRAFHIGSTAIVGMKAKPIIDILIEVEYLSKLDIEKENFEKKGYEVKGEYGIEGRRFFQKRIDKRTHHVHMFEAGSIEIERHRLFVAFMNSHPNKAKEYQTLKENLCSLFDKDPKTYTEGKSNYIKNIDSEAYSWKHS